MLKLYPCEQYREHLEELNSQLSPGDPPICCDTSYCAFASNLSPVAANGLEADEQFWSCPCAAARAQREQKQRLEALWETAKKNREHLIRVIALNELADGLLKAERKPDASKG